MGLLIDTSVFIDLERSVPRGLPTSEESFGSLPREPAFVAAITVSELFYGVHRANSDSRRSRRRDFVLGCLEYVEVLPFDRGTAEVHSRIWSDLEKAGKRIGSNDLLIAATGIYHDLPILTGNAREFERLDELKLLPWFPGASG